MVCLYKMLPKKNCLRIKKSPLPLFFFESENIYFEKNFKRNHLYVAQIIVDVKIQHKETYVSVSSFQTAKRNGENHPALRPFPYQAPT